MNWDRFEIGDKVLCVAHQIADPLKYTALPQNKVYIVSAILQRPMIYLVGYTNTFNAAAFVPADRFIQEQEFTTKLEKVLDEV